MRTALADLKLDHLTVVYPGEQPYSLARNVEVVPLAHMVRATAYSSVFIVMSSDTRFPVYGEDTVWLVAR